MMEDVVREEKIPWDPDSEDITILTDSLAGSEDEISMPFFDDNDQYIGGIGISFKSPQMVYIIDTCRATNLFPVAVPTGTGKMWRISYNQAQLTVGIYCNGVEVLNVVLSDGFCTSGTWRNNWQLRTPTQITFHSRDSASEQYCLVMKPGKY